MVSEKCCHKFCSWFLTENHVSSIGFVLCCCLCCYLYITDAVGGKFDIHLTELFFCVGV